MGNSNLSKLVFLPPVRQNKHLPTNKRIGNSIFFTIDKGNRTSCIQINPSVNYHPDKVIIYSHGNGEDVYSANNFFVNAANIYNIAIVLYDYPGYGLSTGEQNEKDVTDSLYNVIDMYKQYKILLLGFSLGTGVIISCLHKYKLNYPTVLIAPYMSISRLLFNNIFFNSFSYMIADCNFDSYNKVSEIDAPMYLYHGKKDDIIPYYHSMMLIQEIKNESKKLFLYEKANHYDILLTLNFDEIIAYI